MPSYRASDGIRVVVDGVAYSNGAIFTADPDAVEGMVDAGWISPADNAKTTKAESVQDKAVPRKRTPRKRT